MLRAARLPATVAALALLLVAAIHAGAVAPGDPAFQRTWERTDQPVLSGTVSRTWIWGPEANTPVIQEPYAESPNGSRKVQYYDKSRMEINNPAGDPNSLFYVTNGLLVVELMTGNLQLGDNSFQQHAAAIVNVAGDFDDPTGPTYATMALVRDAPPVPDGALITRRINRAGSVTDDPALGAQGVTAAYHVVVPGLDHQVASPFWSIMISSGIVYESGSYVTENLFENPFYATGYPVTEAYWANVKVAGSYRDVLMQCFERRCLTYTPGNPAGFATEAGNVGQHYRTWRYVQIPAEGTPTSTATATGTGAVPTATQTSGALTPTGTTTATASATLTATATTTPVTPLEYFYQEQIGGLGDPVGTAMVLPKGVAVDTERLRIYVVDYERDRVQVFNDSGVFITEWGESGSGPGQFNGPHDVAVDAAGNVYVVEALGARVQKFDMDGAFITQWGGTGIAAAGFSFPGGIAVSADGVVYVSEFARVIRFDTDGHLLSEFGASGNASGEFSNAIDVAVAPDGTVYVVDKNNDRIQAFDGTGQFLRTWGSAGEGDTQFNDPTGVAVNSDGIVYVVDAGNHKIKTFDPDGTFRGAYGEPGTEDDQLDAPFGIATIYDAYLVTDGSATRPGAKIFSEERLIIAWHDDGVGRLSAPMGVEIAAGEGVIVADPGLDALVIFGVRGGEVVTYDGSDDPAGPLEDPTSLASSPMQAAAQAVAIVESSAARFRLLTQASPQGIIIGSEGAGPGQFLAPAGVAIDSAGNVYVSDSERNVIQKFNITGDYLDVWGESGSGNGQFSQPKGLAIFGDTLYVADSLNHRVQYFSLTGIYRGQFGTLGAEPGQFNQPSDIAVDTDGYLFVVDTGNDRVQKFTAAGEWLAEFGETGEGDGQFLNPVGIVVDERGVVYVSDPLLHRVQLFAPPS